MAQMTTLLSEESLSSASPATSSPWLDSHFLEKTSLGSFGIIRVHVSSLSLDNGDKIILALLSSVAYWNGGKKEPVLARKL